MQIKLFSGPGRCFAPLPLGAGRLSFPLPWRERVALSLSKGRVRGPTGRLGAGDTMGSTRLEGEGWGEEELQSKRRPFTYQTIKQVLV